MNEKEKAAEWAACLKHVTPRFLAWHLHGVLIADGERVCAEVLKVMGITSAMDFVRRSS